MAHGISTILHEKPAIIGSAHFVFDDMKVPLTKKDQQVMDQLDGSYSRIYLAIGNNLSGCICIADPPRPEAKFDIQKLRELGIHNIIMLTGDSEKAAASIAKELDINQYKSEV